MKSGIKNKVVTSIYDLNYINERGSGLYKGFDLLTITIRNLIYDDYDYVIYTNMETYNKPSFKSFFLNKPNITIKIKELNSDFYINTILPCKVKKVQEGHIWDRIHSVDNYVEVMYNKFEFLSEESKGFEGNLLWIDAGLFGTSCSNGWRDYMNILCHNKNFLDKCFEKIESCGTISLKGNHIAMNYEEREKLSHLFKKPIFIIPGGLFGGKSSQIYNHFKDYQTVIKSMVETYGFYTSDQEILCICLSEKDDVCFFDHDDWDDLQKGILKILDVYDSEKYNKDVCYFLKESISPEIQIPTTETSKYILNDEIDLTNDLSTEQILSKILTVTNSHLDNFDLSHNDYMLNKMTSFATLFHYPSGREHYRLLTYISKLFKNECLLDIGTCNGCSAIALSENDTNLIESYDVVNYMDGDYIDKKNINFYLKDILEDKSKILNTRFIMLDTNHDGIFENKFYAVLKEMNFKGLLLLDDIFLNQDMKSFWNSITEEKFDITSVGHNTGTGLVYFK